MLNSRDDAARREREIYSSLLNEAFGLKEQIEMMGKAVSMLDFYSSLATISKEMGWTRPEMVDQGEIEILDGRHPVVEAYSERYVPNSFSSTPSRFSLITGPNMAGKSTFLRQVALIVLLAHMGSFVPAKKVTMPIVDKIFCRVGASDNLSRGESTFLVEMSESAEILRSCTDRSLVIMDEIGRGTSTQDGMSLAYAIMRYLMESRAITLFATHYHELTMLDTTGIQLLHMLVKEEKGSVEFLRKAVEGVAESSYGIHVAKIAGLPRSVIKEATSFQHRHFADYSSFSSCQGNLFAVEDKEDDSLEREILEEIRAFDVDSSSPLSALQFLSELKKKLGER